MRTYQALIFVSLCANAASVTNGLHFQQQSSPNKYAFAQSYSWSFSGNSLNPFGQQSQTLIPEALQRQQQQPQNRHAMEQQAREEQQRRRQAQFQQAMEQQAIQDQRRQIQTRKVMEDEQRRQQAEMQLEMEQELQRRQAQIQQTLEQQAIQNQQRQAQTRRAMEEEQQRQQSQMRLEMEQELQRRQAQNQQTLEQQAIQDQQRQVQARKTMEEEQQRYQTQMRLAMEQEQRRRQVQIQQAMDQQAIQDQQRRQAQIDQAMNQNSVNYNSINAFIPPNQSTEPVSNTLPGGNDWQNSALQDQQSRQAQDNRAMNPNSVDYNSINGFIPPNQSAGPVSNTLSGGSDWQNSALHDQQSRQAQDNRAMNPSSVDYNSINGFIPPNQSTEPVSNTLPGGNDWQNSALQDQQRRQAQDNQARNPSSVDYNSIYGFIPPNQPTGPVLNKWVGGYDWPNSPVNSPSSNSNQISRYTNNANPNSYGSNTNNVDGSLIETFNPTKTTTTPTQQYNPTAVCTYNCVNSQSFRQPIAMAMAMANSFFSMNQATDARVGAGSFSYTSV